MSEYVSIAVSEEESEMVVTPRVLTKVVKTLL